MPISRWGKTGEFQNKTLGILASRTWLVSQVPDSGLKWLCALMKSAFLTAWPCGLASKIAYRKIGKIYIHVAYTEI